MLKNFRAEHILAIFVTGLFLICDIAVLYFFISAFDPTPDIASQMEATEHRVIQTPMLSAKTLTVTTIGGDVDSKADAIEQLQKVLSEQLKTMTETKSAP